MNFDFEFSLILDSSYHPKNKKKTKILPVKLSTIKDSEAASTTKTVATPTEIIIIMRLLSLGLAKLR